MDIADLAVGMVALLVGLAAGIIAYRAYVQDGDVRADAQKWRSQDDARRDAADAKAAESEQQRRLGARHKHQIEEALQILEKVQDAACLVVTRERLLTVHDFHKFELQDHARRLGNIGARLPQGNVRSSLDGDSSVSELIYALLAAPFDDRIGPVEAIGRENDEEPPELWRVAYDAGNQAIAQYEAARSLCDAIDQARDKLCDLLPY